LTTTLKAGGQQLNMCTTPPPSGGVIVAHILSILEGYNMGPQDFTTVSQQVTALHRIAEAFKLSFAKRPLLGDPENVYVVKVGCVFLSSEAACGLDPVYCGRQITSFITTSECKKSIYEVWRCKCWNYITESLILVHLQLTERSPLQSIPLEQLSI